MAVRASARDGVRATQAQAIARNIHILNPDGSQDKDAVDCNDLRPGGEYLETEEMDALTNRVNVFARAKPEDKLEIVKSLQRQWFGWVLALIGALICMTGCELYKCYVKHYAPPPI